MSRPAVFLALIVFLNSGCAYRFGLSERTLPGGYTQIAIPIFKNRTSEVGIEPAFTNALIRRFGRSKVARVTDLESAPVVLEGTIVALKTRGDSPVNNREITTLPSDTVLMRQYRLEVTSEIILRRKSDDRVIWQGSFTNEEVYSPPRIGTAVVNSANATYNQSARMEFLSRLADDMMAEAHDQITDDF